MAKVLKIGDLEGPIGVSKPEKEETSAEFIGGLFHCRDTVHLAHLRSKSYSEHIALGDLYDAIGDAADDLCELIQGYKGLLSISIPSSKYITILPYIKQEQKELIEEVGEYGNMPDVQNKIQDLLAVFSKTIYKLENLK